MDSHKPIFIRSSKTVLDTSAFNEQFIFSGMHGGKLRAMAVITVDMGNFPVDCTPRGVFDVTGYWTVGRGILGGTRKGKFSFNAPAGTKQQVTVEFLEPFEIFDTSNLSFQINTSTMFPGNANDDYCYLVQVE